MIQVTKIFLFIGVITCVTACYDNQIYFDKNTQAVKTCNESPIRSLMIDTQGEYSYHFIKSDGKEGTNLFSLKTLNENYRLEIRGQEYPLQQFTLRPDSEYVIMNLTYGDASEGKVKIKTNDKGVVIEADDACN